MLPASVVILENHPLALRTIMAQVGEVLPEAALTYSGEDVRAAVAAVGAHPAGTLVLLDLTLGAAESPAEVTRALVASGGTVIIISANEDVDLVADAVAAGAYAFIPKRHLGRQLPSALAALGEGRGWLSPDFAGVLASAAATRLDQATTTALLLYAAGFPDSWISERVGWPVEEVQQRLLAGAGFSPPA